MQSVNKTTMLLKSIFLFLFGIIISFMIVQAYATSVTGDEYSFKVGSIGYHNYATLSMTSSSGSRSSVICRDSGTSPAGYLGAKSSEYKQLSDGSYSLQDASPWYYSTEALSTFEQYTSSTGPTSSGYYMCQGQTAVYYNGKYQTQNTYATPLIKITKS